MVQLRTLPFHRFILQTGDIVLHYHQPGVPDSWALPQTRFHLFQAIGPHKILGFQPFIYTRIIPLIKALINFEGDLAVNIEMEGVLSCLKCAH